MSWEELKVWIGDGMNTMQNMVCYIILCHIIHVISQTSIKHSINAYTSYTNNVNDHVNVQYQKKMAYMTNYIYGKTKSSNMHNNNKKYNKKDMTNHFYQHLSFIYFYCRAF